MIWTNSVKHLRTLQLKMSNNLINKIQENVTLLVKIKNHEKNIYTYCSHYFNGKQY